MYLNKQDWRGLIGFTCLKIVTSSALLWIWWWMLLVPENVMFLSDLTTDNFSTLRSDTQTFLWAVLDSLCALRALRTSLRRDVLSAVGLHTVAHTEQRYKVKTQSLGMCAGCRTYVGLIISMKQELSPEPVIAQSANKISHFIKTEHSLASRISGFDRGVVEAFALLECQEAWFGQPVFLDSLTPSRWERYFVPKRL